MILQVISQSGNIYTKDIVGLRNILTPSVDVSTDTIAWFTPYLASDYPDITCDKTYFFLWSTDHDQTSPESAGGFVCWGKGNNLDLSDFEELGTIVSGYQAETPFLYIFPDNTRTIHLYYHTATSDPGNSGVQQTRLISTNDSVLHTATWTDEGRPLGTEVDDLHTGYLKFYDVDGTLKGTHYKQGSNAGTGYIGQWQHSVMDADGLGCTRGDLVDNTTNVSANRRTIPSYGTFFKKYGQWWWIGETETNEGFSLTSETKGFAVFRSNSDLEFVEEIKQLDNGTLRLVGWNVYIIGDTAHIYGGSPDGSPLKYATYDLTDLTAYL